MQKTKLRALFAILAVMLVAIPTSMAFGQTTGPTLTDQQLNIVIIAVFTGALAAPIVGYATSAPKVGTDGKPLPTQAFNWRQYALAEVVALPSAFALILVEINTLHVSVTGNIGTIMIFIMVFMQALGIDYGKSRIANAIQGS